MTTSRQLQLPLSADGRAGLRVGDELRLSGPCFTARDATMSRLLELARKEGTLPDHLKDQLFFFAGPTPAHPGNPGHPFGSIGPTTASRMDVAQQELMPLGLLVTLGKGDRSAVYRKVARHYKAVYFAAAGGAAAIYAQHVVSGETVAWPELGTEALMRLELKDFPVIVAIDAQGGDIYEC